MRKMGGDTESVCSVTRRLWTSSEHGETVAARAAASHPASSWVPSSGHSLDARLGTRILRSWPAHSAGHCQGVPGGAKYKDGLPMRTSAAQRSSVPSSSQTTESNTCSSSASIGRQGSHLIVSATGLADEWLSPTRSSAMRLSASVGGHHNVRRLMSMAKTPVTQAVAKPPRREASEAINSLASHIFTH